ncbi:MAG: arginine--tRNA ligase [Armatimonadetes bacterium]|nr:arginine--tRNA ligase [Armatimonadota bacterium]
MAETVLVEILSADPIGPLSLIHGRTAVQGDVLANLFAFFGHEVRREYYVNDVGGRAVTLCDAVRHYILSHTEGDAVEGRYDPIVRYIADQLSDRLGERAPETSDEEWNRLCETIPGLLLHLQRNTLAHLNVQYETWFEERNLTPERVEEGIRRLRDSGAVKEIGGALWIETQRGERALLRRENGDFTYFAVDIAYHLSKAERGATRMIDVWGPAYHRHRARLVEAMKDLGVQAPLEVIVTGGIRLENDGVPVVYFDAASVLLDPLLDRGAAAGLRALLNTAPPEEDLVLDLDELNTVATPPAVQTAWKVSSAWGGGIEHPDHQRLRAALQALEAVRPGDSPSLLKEARRAEAVLQEACSRYRPDLVYAFLASLAREYESASGDRHLESWEPERRTAIAEIFSHLLHLLGIPSTATAG